MKPNTLSLVSALIFAAAPLLSAQQQDLQRRIATTVREMGTVEAVSSVEIRCQLPGQTTILWVASEGAQVEKGDLLVKFDRSKIEEQVDLLRAEVNQAKAATFAAKAEAASLKLRWESVKRITALQAKAADLERDAILGAGGKLDLERRKAESEIRVRKAAAAAAEENTQRWKREHPDQVPPGDLNLATVAAQEMLGVAERQLKYVATVLQPRESAAYDLEQSRTKLESQTDQFEAERDLSVAKANQAAAEEQLATSSNRLEGLLQQLQNCNVTAPKAGTVVHANQSSSRTGGFTVEPGAVVREGQAVMRLPDLAKLQVRTLVNETRISLVREGQQAKVALDAMPGRSIPGIVESVARTARPTSFLTSDIKEYEVVVRLVETPKFIRIGMTALVEIKVDKTGALIKPPQLRPLRSEVLPVRSPATTKPRERQAFAAMLVGVVLIEMAPVGCLANALDRDDTFK